MEAEKTEDTRIDFHFMLVEVTKIYLHSIWNALHLFTIFTVELLNHVVMLVKKKERKIEIWSIMKAHCKDMTRQSEEALNHGR